MSLAPFTGVRCLLGPGRPGSPEAEVAFSLCALTRPKRVGREHFGNLSEGGRSRNREKGDSLEAPDCLAGILLGSHRRG